MAKAVLAKTLADRSMTLVNVEISDGVAVVTLNRADKMNALSRALQTELAAAIEAVSGDPEVRVVILTGAGERAFSAGLDLKEVGEFGLSQGEARTAPTDPVRALGDCPKPVIGAINGVAVTGGFELALACDILIASTNARFADTHVRVGVIPGWGLSQRLSRLIGVSRAKELSFSGNYLDAATALAWGLVNRVVEPQALMPAARQLAADIASCDPDMVRRYKALIDDGFGLPFGEAMSLERARSRAGNTGVTAESVASRRATIQARGRGQID
jgi:enoyl-CoA hydratase